MSRDPVFIIGLPRSGTSFIFRLLSSSGEFEVLNESNLMWRTLSNDGSDIPAGELQAKREPRRRIVQRLRRSNSELRVLEKAPSNTLRLEFLKTHFPNATFVFLERELDDIRRSMMVQWTRARTIHEKRIDSNQSILRQRLGEINRFNWTYALSDALRIVLQKALKRRFVIWGPRLSPSFPLRQVDPTSYVDLQVETCSNALSEGLKYFESPFILDVTKMTEEDVNRLCVHCDIQATDRVLNYFNARYKKEL